MNMTNNISYSLEIIDYDLRIVLSFLFCFTFWGVCVCVCGVCLVIKITKLYNVLLSPLHE